MQASFNCKHEDLAIFITNYQTFVAPEETFIHSKVD